MIKRRRFPKIFFGWGTIVAGSWLNFWTSGVHSYGFSALFKPISSELGFSRAVTSVAAGIGRFGGGLEAPLTGWLTDRFGPRKVIIFGVFLFSLSLILMNFVNSLWAFYLVWGFLLGTGTNTSSGMPMATAIANWFVKKRGLATSLRWMFSGVLVLPIITWLIVTQGWRMACVISGLVMLVVGLPLNWFWVRDRRPEYYGLLPDGAKVEAGLKEDTSQMIKRGIEYATEVEEVEFTVRQAIRTPAYWMLIIAQTAHGVGLSSLLMHFIPFLTDMGIDPVKAAAMVTMAGFAGIVSRLIIGPLADRVKKGYLRFLFGGACFLQAGGIALFVLNQTMAMVYPFLILYFTGMGVILILIPLIGGRYFGRKAFGSIHGTSMMFTTPVGILGPIYFGWIYDTTGSYITAFTLIAVFLAIGAVLIFLARPPKPPAEVTDIRKIV